MDAEFADVPSFIADEARKVVKVPGQIAIGASFGHLRSAQFANVSVDLANVDSSFANVSGDFANVHASFANVSDEFASVDPQFAIGRDDGNLVSREEPLVAAIFAKVAHVGALHRGGADGVC